jgi:dipeptidyl aminopeptidase/acylaminoacyl peptidase
MKKGLIIILILLSLVSYNFPTYAQDSPNNNIIERIDEDSENLRHRLDVLEKKVDDIIWYQRIGDAAFIDKVYLAGPPRWKIKDTTAQGAKNPLKFWSYVFIPKGIDFNKKYPLIVFPHGGVHSNFTTYYTHIVKELLAQQYIVVAAEYRGSTGYGKGVYERIDYGGLEYEDVDVSRQYMIDNYSFVDGDRDGNIGWSHGGLITLMNIFEHPDNYKVAFAGVPVSDLIARMGYQTQAYRDLYSADYHIGQTAHENVEEYRRRSPAWQTHKFRNTPLLIHTNTNDDDVNVLEVEHLIKSLKADGKKFDYKIFKDIPGGHSFDRIDRKRAKEIRLTIYAHLAKELRPPKQLKTLADITEAAYLK